MPGSEEISIRPARREDLAEVTAIYAHHVRHGLASFEYDPPGEIELARRYEALISGGYPYVVAKNDNQIVGYAYAGPFRDRPGYRYSVESTVYLAPDAAGHGIGFRLLAEIIERATEAGFRQMFAVIGDTGNTASIRIHEKAGFRHCGILEASGFKLGQWVDSVYMQRALGDGDTTLP